MFALQCTCPELQEGKGIQILQDLGFVNLKINAVLLNGVNASTKDFNAWSDFIKTNKVNFRYIELMQTGDNLDYFNKYHISSKIFSEYLIKNNWIFQKIPNFTTNEKFLENFFFFCLASPQKVRGHVPDREF